MALFGFLGKKQTYSEADISRVIQQALFEYQINSGTANVMPDDPEAYLKEGYSGNVSVIRSLIG